MPEPADGLRLERSASVRMSSSLIARTITTEDAPCGLFLSPHGRTPGVSRRPPVHLIFSPGGHKYE